MYFMTFFPNGEYCFQVAEMTTPCRFGLDEVDLLVEINNQACDICGFPGNLDELSTTMTLTVGLVIAEKITMALETQHESIRC